MGQVTSFTSISPSTAILGVLSSFFLYGAFKAFSIVFRRTELRNIPGPQKGHIIFGNMQPIFKAGPSEQHALWQKEFGDVYVYHNFFNMPRLFMNDLRAITHILQQTEIYHKSEFSQRLIGQLLGFGILVTEDERHRIQRKALNPAFGVGKLRDLTGIFLDKANELRDMLLFSANGTRIDVLPYLNRTTLDVIGLAGFGYKFNTLADGNNPNATNEMDQAFRKLFGAAQSNPLNFLFTMLIPFWRHIPTARNRRTKESMSVMRRIGTQLLEERKAAAIAEATKGEKISTSGARDLLSLLVRANTAADPRERLSDEDVLAQIPTFLVAGHETTASLLTWILYQLSIHAEVQTALRDECRANPLPSTQPHGNDPLSTEELNQLDHLPLLDAVVRETLRLNSPVSMSVREAVKDDVLPVEKPFVDRNGVVKDSITIKKGDDIFIPVQLINQSPELWGPDALEWDPSRFTENRVPAAIKGIPSVWGNVLSFLAGSHACIGYRFSLYETKIILHALITSLSFELAVPKEDIEGRTRLVTTSFVKSEKDVGAQMPLIVKRVVEEDN